MRRVSATSEPATPTLNQLMESHRSGFPDSRRSVNPAGTGHSLGMDSTVSGETVPQGGKGMVRVPVMWCIVLHSCFHHC